MFSQQNLKKKMGGFKFPVIAVSVFLTAFSVCISPRILLAGPRLDALTASGDVENPVPYDLIEKMAMYKLQEVFGKGAIGGAIPLSDANGAVIAYMFSYHIGGKQFPAYGEILSKIKKGRELRGCLQRSEIEEGRKIYKKFVESEEVSERESFDLLTPDQEISSKPQQIESVRLDGTRPRRREMAEIKEMEKFASQKIIGAGEFGTIVISATYDAFPIPVYMHYLAPYYINFDLALEKAKKDLGDGAFLQKIYFAGLDGQFFEFVSGDGDSRLLINCKSLETKYTLEAPEKRIEDLRSSSAISDVIDVREDIANDWKNLEYDVEVKK